VSKEFIPRNGLFAGFAMRFSGGDLGFVDLLPMLL
jgi:hypothetical protein